MNIYVLNLTTESGDDYVWAFQTKPTIRQVDALFAQQLPEEWETDSCQSWSIEEIEVLNPMDIHFDPNDYPGMNE